jgi:hypothetical protein
MTIAYANMKKSPLLVQTYYGRVCKLSRMAFEKQFVSPPWVPETLMNIVGYDARQQVSIGEFDRISLKEPENSIVLFDAALLKSQHI